MSLRCDGVLIASRPGIFMHRSQHALNYINTAHFQEFSKTEVEECVILDLRCLSAQQKAGLCVMLTVQEGDELKDLLLATKLIQ